MGNIVYLQTMETSEDTSTTTDEMSYEISDTSLKDTTQEAKENELTTALPPFHMEHLEIHTEYYQLVASFCANHYLNKMFLLICLQLVLISNKYNKI